MAKYDFISTTEVQGLIPVMKDGKWGLVSYDDYDKEIVEPRWDTPPQEENYGLIGIVNKEKQGLLNSQGKEILPVIYENIFVQSKNRITVERIDDRYAIYNNKGIVLIPFKEGYSCLIYFSDDRIIAHKKGKAGVIDITQKEIIPFVYDSIFWDEKHEVYIIETEGLTGVVDKNGKEIVSCGFQDVFLHDKFIMVIFDNKVGILDYEGQSLVACKYEALQDARENLIIFKEKGKYGLINISGKQILPPTYDDIEPFVHGYAKVTDKKGRKGIIDTNGELVCETIYEEVGHFVNKFAAVKINGRWGFINELGVECIPPKYKDYKRLSEEYIAVCCDDDKWAIISVFGFEKKPAIYDSIKRGQDNQIIVTIDGMEGIVKL